MPSIDKTNKYYTMNELTPLTAVSPIDGRYRSNTIIFSGYFSEFALIKYRIMIECEYFIALRELPLPQIENMNTNFYQSIRDIYNNFTPENAQEVKNIEKTTNHDVKAVEYYIKSKFDELGINKYREFIHFGLTSQDINNTAVPYALKQAMNEVYYPSVYEILDKLKAMADEWKNIAMLAHTHGQPASPTRLGKEIAVYTERIEQQIQLLKAIPISAKFGGATGNFNAHHVAYQQIDWVSFGNKFLNERLGLERQQTTTQIEHYDCMAALFDGVKRINTILTDLNRDLWTYISMEYFRQKIKKGEVGSSAMPHKVNPIDFENSEGNLGIANAVFEHLSAKLPISRLQRDLTDSTVTRNIGVPFSHTLIAFKSLLKGLNKLIINKDALDRDLNANWAVVAEAIQTILRREGIPNPYEMLKDLTRTNEHIDKESIRVFIDKLSIPDNIKAELKQITPFNYTGI